VLVFRRCGGVYLGEVLPDLLEGAKGNVELDLGALDESQARNDVKVTDDLCQSEEALGEALIEGLGGGVEVNALDVRLVSLDEILLTVVEPLVAVGVLGLDLLLDIGSPLDLGLHSPI